MTERARYHHGDLRRALLDAALAMVGESGPDGVRLREVARRAGVSHAAPAHHFTDRAGLLTALAAEGHRMLADELTDALARTGEFLETGVAYVGFATRNPSYFQVMYRPDLVRGDDPELRAALEAEAAVLYPTAGAAVGGGQHGVDAAVAAWSLVHGLATLWNLGLLPGQDAEEAEHLARRAAAFLFGGPCPDDEPPAAGGAAPGDA